MIQSSCSVMGDKNVSRSDELVLAILKRTVVGEEDETIQSRIKHI